MATTKTITAHTVDAVRANDDGTLIVVMTVTYADATTAKLEIPAMRLVP